MTPRAADTARRGFSLVELILSAVVLTVLLGAMTFSLTVASRAVEGPLGPAGKTVSAASVAEEINADLALATSFPERSATAVTVTVPDRDGDAAEERIRYWWAGAADGRLYRQVNDGPAVVVAEDVRYFDLDYLLKTVEAGSPPPGGTGGSGGSGGSADPNAADPNQPAGPPGGGGGRGGGGGKGAAGKAKQTGPKQKNPPKKPTPGGGKGKSPKRPTWPWW